MHAHFQIFRRVGDDAVAFFEAVHDEEVAAGLAGDGYGLDVHEAVVSDYGEGVVAYEGGLGDHVGGDGLAAVDADAVFIADDDLVVHVVHLHFVGGVFLAVFIGLALQFAVPELGAVAHGDGEGLVVFRGVEEIVHLGGDFYDGGDGGVLANHEGWFACHGHVGVTEVNLGNHAADGGADGAGGDEFLHGGEGGNEAAVHISLHRLGLGAAAFEAIVLGLGDDALAEEGGFHAVVDGGGVGNRGGRALGNLSFEGGGLGFVLGGVDLEEDVSRFDYGAHVRGIRHQASRYGGNHRRRVDGFDGGFRF